LGEDDWDKSDEDSNLEYETKNEENLETFQKDRNNVYFDPDPADDDEIPVNSTQTQAEINQHNENSQSAEEELGGTDNDLPPFPNLSAIADQNDDYTYSEESIIANNDNENNDVNVASESSSNNHNSDSNETSSSSDSSPEDDCDFQDFIRHGGGGQGGRAASVRGRGRGRGPGRILHRQSPPTASEIDSSSSENDYHLRKKIEEGTPYEGVQKNFFTADTNYPSIHLIEL